MYFRDFNPQKYNNNIYLADLCINDCKIITYKELVDIKNYNFLIYPYIDFVYNITNLNADKVNKLCFFAKREQSFKNVKNVIIGKNMYLILSFYVKDECIPEYKIRSKYGLKYAGKTELIQFYSFWNGYINFIPTKKAAARESSRLIFILSLLVSCSNFYYLQHRNVAI